MNKAQIGIVPLLGIGSAILIAAIGGFLAQSRYVDEKIDTVKVENSITTQRVATIEEAVRTIKQDNQDIKKDLKEILRLMK